MTAAAMTLADFIASNPPPGSLVRFGGKSGQLVVLRSGRIALEQEENDTIMTEFGRVTRHSARLFWFDMKYDREERFEIIAVPASGTVLVVEDEKGGGLRVRQLWPADGREEAEDAIARHRARGGSERLHIQIAA